MGLKSWLPRYYRKYGSINYNAVRIGRLEIGWHCRVDPSLWEFPRERGPDKLRLRHYRAAARALGLSDRTLRRMLSGEMPIAADDPVMGRARETGGRE